MEGIYQDTKRLDHEVLALFNKVIFHLPDAEPRTVKEHVTHLGSKIDAVNNVLQVDATHNEQVRLLFSTYGSSLSGIISECMKLVLKAVADQVNPIELFFTDGRTLHASSLNVVAPYRPIVGEYLMDRLTHVKGMANQRQTPHQQFSPSHKFVRSGLRMNSANV